MLRKIEGRLFSALIVLLMALAVSCASSSRDSSSDIMAGERGLFLFEADAVNTPENIKKPYLVLVSIDGYRHDYNKLFAPPNLVKLEKEGVSAKGLRPPYPSKTFPSHYSIATGLHPGRHGIVSNEFYDPSRRQYFSLRDRNAVENGEWYFGEPLWTAIGRQGMLTASFFWVGTEARVAGRYPNYFYYYDVSIPYQQRVDQVLSWLKLPEERRPHFITVYFDAVDTAAHVHGIFSPENKKAVMMVDEMIGHLREGLSKLDFAVNLMVVSDHGALDLDRKKVIVLDKAPEAAKILSKFLVVGRGPQINLYLKENEAPESIEEAYRVLNKHIKHARVFKRSQMENLHYASTPRAGDLIVDADAPYVVGLREQMPGTKGANHGWNPRQVEDMNGIFYAAGPQFKKQHKMPVIDNIHIYPLVLKVLGLRQLSPIDGRLDSVEGALVSTH